MTVPDSSFLFSFYGDDAHSPRAIAAAHSLDMPLTMTLLHRFEFENALRLAIFRRLITHDDANRRLMAFESDLSARRIIVRNLALNPLLETARRLSSRFTETLGQRALDLLIVAAALELGATNFLTFDHRQRALAEAAGMNVTFEPTTEGT